MFCSIYILHVWCHKFILRLLDYHHSGHSNVTVRLAGGSHPGEGRVEVYFAGEWGRVCEYGWDINDARVICSMLGYIEATHSTSAGFGEGSGPIWLTYVRCSGTESNIASCPVSYRWGQSHACTEGYSKDAGVVCLSREKYIHTKELTVYKCIHLFTISFLIKGF